MFFLQILLESLNFSIYCDLSIWSCSFKARLKAELTLIFFFFFYLNLHLEVGLEVGQKCEENGQGEFEDLRHRRDAVFGQRNAQVLLDGVDEHLVGLEDGPSVLQDGQQQLQGQDL